MGSEPMILLPLPEPSPADPYLGAFGIGWRANSLAGRHRADHPGCGLTHAELARRYARELRARPPATAARVEGVA
jgi:hypothetical protein